MSELPGAVQQAHAALKAGAWSQARVHVEQGLAKVEDPAVLARLHGWHAQVLSELGEFMAARTAVRQALLAARDLGQQDPLALAPLKALHGRIIATLAADAAADKRQVQAQALAALPLSELLDRATGSTERAGVYLARADALVDAGQLDDVPGLIHRGLQEAPHEATREQVLLRLAHLRVRPDHAAGILAQALELAEDAGSETLVTACAHAARRLGLPLPEPEF